MFENWKWWHYALLGAGAYVFLGDKDKKKEQTNGKVRVKAQGSSSAPSTPEESSPVAPSPYLGQRSPVSTDPLVMEWYDSMRQIIASAKMRGDNETYRWAMERLLRVRRNPELVYVYIEDDLQAEEEGEMMMEEEGPLSSSQESGGATPESQSVTEPPLRRRELPGSEQTAQTIPDPDPSMQQPTASTGQPYPPPIPYYGGHSSPSVPMSQPPPPRPAPQPMQVVPAPAPPPTQPGQQGVVNLPLQTGQPGSQPHSIMASAPASGASSDPKTLTSNPFTSGPSGAPGWGSWGN